ncbi:MAG: PilZ domain-containing protein [Acidobacteria bacterium]|nr:PilZ domain-containing protein [Acidobacteriota bacterium]
MGKPGAGRESRRSSRVALSIPVEVTTVDSAGKPVRESATTQFVNEHGVCFCLGRCLPLGTEIVVSIPHLGREQRCKVVWVSKETNEQGQYEIGVELPQAGNFWGVGFPPSDWVAASQLPLAGDPHGPILSPTPGDDEELYRIRAMLNALVAVLEQRAL